MNRIVIISNRLPVNIKIEKNELTVEKSIGGLATGLSSFYKEKDFECIWIGWPGLPSEDLQYHGEDKDLENNIRKMLADKNCIPVNLSQEEIDGFYYGYCNNVIWPLFHYFLEYTEFNDEQWEMYKKVNEKFSNVIAPIVREDDIIWIHDYQLCLLPGLLRKTNPNLKIGFFLHIPFPSFEMFRSIPNRTELLSGLLGADLIGFHIYDYVRHFLSSARRILGVNVTLNKIKTEERLIKVEAFPMGIDFKKFHNAHLNPQVQTELDEIKSTVENRKLILSIDRLDYSKGIIHRLNVIERFFEKYPEFIKKVTFVFVIVPSRENVERYQLIKKEIDEIIGRINGKYGTIGWVAIWYLYRQFDFSFLASLYIISDIALVTPLRDGMNLVAKEFIASKHDQKGFLILSELTGAVVELGEAEIINPYNEEQIILTIKKCIESDLNVSVAKNRVMQNRLKRYDINRWVQSFIEILLNTKQEQELFLVKKISNSVHKKLNEKFTKAKKKLIILDYDGTCTPIVKNPADAIPDDELISILTGLRDNENTTLLIVSGRDKNFLEKYLSKLNLIMIAEHGIWVKRKNEEWSLNIQFENKWKDEIRPILETYSDLTPRTFIEEKTFSLVWHYRNADPDLGPLRAQELKDAIISLTANYNLGILEGKKVLDIKPLSINKGIAVGHFLVENYDFVLSIGDDVTDEDTFNVLPEQAYTIKVGTDSSIAKYYLNNVLEVRNLLKSLIL